VLLEVQRRRMKNNNSSSATSVSSVSDSSRCLVVDDDNANAYYYLTPNAAKKLPNYRYQGEDLSPIYKHVLSPLASWCVDNLTPTWMAPNAITLLGLLWMALSYSVIWFWCPGLCEANTELNAAYTVPGAIFLLNGCAMLIYQTLDNMDGKQARKTGSSSPLGLLFDHGCDAVNSLFGSANWIAAMAMIPGNVRTILGEDSDNVQTRSIVSDIFGGDAMLACILILGPMTAFYVSTWEQYHTGKLVLPPFNGPTEGLLIGASLSIISFVFGPMFWQNTSLADAVIVKLTTNPGGQSFIATLEGRVRNMDLIVLTSVVLVAHEVILKALDVMRKYGVQALRTLIPNAILCISTIMIVLLDSTIFIRIPRIMMHLICGLFVEQTIQLMLDHILEQNFEVKERLCLVPQVLLVAGMLSGVAYSNEALDAFLLVYTTGLWVYLAFKIRIQVYEICDVLGIYCFDIVTCHPKSTKEEDILGTTIPAIGNEDRKRK